jgi:general secretion pathway protein M
MKLKERLERLEERERRLLMILVSVFCGMLLVFGPVALLLSVGSQGTANDRVKEVIQQIDDERVSLAKIQADIHRVESRYARKAPALAGFLAETANAVGVEIPETQDRSTVPHGKIFNERVTKIQLRRVGMHSLATFMDRIENSGYAVSLSRLTIRKRGTAPDEFDAEMEVSAYDREVAQKGAGKARDNARAGDAP